VKSKLSLGTAQFGYDYGISNQTGRIEISEASAIINFARKMEIRTIDTAINYGESEICLGSIGVNEFEVITKLPDVPEGEIYLEHWVENQINSSLSRLGIEQLQAVLFHRSAQILDVGGNEIMNVLEKLKQTGRIKQIGVSIYSPNELEALISKYKIDIIQVPMSVFDRRLEQSGWLRKLKDLGIEVHARSVFLQGLLLLKRKSLPVRFKAWENVFNQWHNWLDARSEVSATEVCLGYIHNKVEVSKVIVGVDNLKQFEELFMISDNLKKVYDPKIFIEDEKLLHPYNWNDL
jgi:aryl-alcohol dehydrogenase-like predicted oxidoreductase